MGRKLVWMWQRRNNQKRNRDAQGETCVFTPHALNNRICINGFWAPLFLTLSLSLFHSLKHSFTRCLSVQMIWLLVRFYIILFLFINNNFGLTGFWHFVSMRGDTEKKIATNKTHAQTPMQTDKTCKCSVDSLIGGMNFD